MTALSIVLVAAAAAVVHWLLHRLARRLPVALARRAGGPRPAGPLPFSRTLALILLPVKAALWFGVVYFVTDRVPALHSARDMLRELLAMGVRAPLFTANGRAYSTRDVLALPALLVGLWVVVSAVTHLLRAHVLQPAGVERGAQDTFATLARVVLTFLGAIVAFQAWGIDVSSLTIVASVVGVGLGFGLQNIANNFVSGLLLNVERPVKPGDFVSVAGFTGTVERVGARSTEIRTTDHVTILVPNSRLFESELVNWSHRTSECRLHLPVGVAYGSSIPRVRAALLEAARGHAAVRADPRPRVELRGFGPSALDFELLVWTDDPRTQEQLKSDLNYRIEAAFRRHGIAIPFPQQDVHVRSPALERVVAAWSRREFPDDELAAMPPADEPDADASAPYEGEGGERAWTAEELDMLATRMEGPDGVAIRDRRHLLTVYRRCFVGSEAVSWLIAAADLSRDEALAVGRRLLERGVFHHVLDEHGFEDAHLYYRVAADEAEPSARAGVG